MGKDINNQINNINAVISNTLAQTVNQSKTAYSSNNVNIQISKNTSGCDQYIDSTSQTLYYASSSIFNQQTVLQSVYAQIVSVLQNSQNIDITGFGGSLNANQVTTLMSLIQTNLTSDMLTNQENNISNANYNVQYCIGSKHNSQVIISSSENITYLYFQQYSTNSAVQKVSADIANYVSQDQTVKVTGILASLLKVVALFFIIVIVIVVIIAIVIGLGALKSVGG